jgi:hypothetical protein
VAEPRNVAARCVEQQEMSPAMTIGAVAKLRGVVVAVADGRLAREGRVSLDTAAKIGVIRPEYRYPVSSMGTVDRGQTYHLYGWCLLYAGTYALASEIRDAFRSAVTGLLVDRVPGGDVDFVDEWSGDHKGNDEFHIGPTELPKITARIVLDELRRAYQAKGDEWMVNRVELPDVEFILFGTDGETGAYEAYVVSLDVAHTAHGRPLALKVERVDDMRVAAIGSPTEASKILGDATLAAAVRDSVPPPSPPGTLDAILDAGEPSRHRKVATRMVELAREASDPEVGGQLLLAIGTSSHDIRVVQVD